MNAEQLYQYLDSVRLKHKLDKIPVYVSEKQGLFGVRNLDCAVLVSASSHFTDSIVLCPVSMTRLGKELTSIFGDSDGSEENSSQN